jgi:cysteine desulfurase
MEAVDDNLTGYFDYAATAPPFPAAVEAQRAAALRWFGNPSAGHRPGQQAKAELERLKCAFGELCGFADGRVVLTSGATEANTWVIDSVLRQHPDGRVLVAADVHDSVWNACLRQSDRMDAVSPDGTGRIPLTRIRTALRPDTRLFCVSHAANETGTVHDVAALAALCERNGVLCLVDGVQALGHLPVNLAEIPAEFYTFSAHKFGGPRGVGGVFLRAAELPALLAGGPQEWGMRPGTENLPGLAGAVAALEAAVALLPTETGRLRRLTCIVLDGLRAAGIEFELNGDPEVGLPGLLSLSFPGRNGQTLAADLGVRDFAVASGSACHTDQPEPSRVILALGRKPATALGTLRVSFGRHSREDAVRHFVSVLIRTLHRQHPDKDSAYYRER